jgi:predicted transcriptional regulator
MACIKPDGTLTPSAKSLLGILSEPLGPEEIAVRLNQPLFKVRGILREMVNAGLAAGEGEKYSVTLKGKEKL